MTNDLPAQPWPESGAMGLTPLLPPGWAVYRRPFRDRDGEWDDVMCMAPTQAAAKDFVMPNPTEMQFQASRPIEVDRDVTALAAHVTANLLGGIDWQALDAALSNGREALLKNASEHVAWGRVDEGVDLYQQADALVTLALRLGCRVRDANLSC